METDCNLLPIYFDNMTGRAAPFALMLLRKPSLEILAVKVICPSTMSAA